MRPPDPRHDQSCQECSHRQMLSLSQIEGMHMLQNKYTGETFVSEQPMSLHFSGQHGYVSIQGQTQWCRSMLAWSVWRTDEGKEFVCKLHQDGVELLWLEDYQKQKKFAYVKEA